MQRIQQPGQAREEKTTPRDAGGYLTEDIARRKLDRVGQASRDRSRFRVFRKRTMAFVWSSVNFRSSCAYPSPGPAFDSVAAIPS